MFDMIVNKNANVQAYNPQNNEDVNLEASSDMHEIKSTNEVTTEQTTFPDHQSSKEKSDKKDTDENHDVVPVSNVSEAERQLKKLPFPKTVFFIIFDEFCKSFSYYAFRSILVIYMTHQLGFNNDDATIIFHGYSMIGYFLCILGAIISDSWLGRFKTICYFSLVYIIGYLLFAIGAIPTLNVPTMLFTIIGLVLINLGMSAVQPSVSAFGGDQFKMPEQEKQLTTFFSFFYFAVNAASLISFIVTPILREDVSCFGEKECYFLAFGVPVVVVAVSLVIFILGRPLYKTKPPAGNVVVLVSKTIGNAIATKWKEQKTNPREHWLDYAEAKHDRQLIDDIKVLMRVAVLFLPLPIFWALFNQQGSRWTIQATRMDGDMGSWNIKPDQMQMFNPLLVLAFIPLCEMVLYPLLSLVGIRRPLQKLTLGGIFAGIAFIISGLVELKLEQTYPILPSEGIAQLRVYNGELCDYTITTNVANLNFDINSLDMYVNKNINIDSSSGLNIQFQFTIKSGSNCPTLPNQSCPLQAEKAHYVFLNSKNTTHPIICAEDTVAKPSRGYPLGRALANVNPSRTIQWKNSKGSIEQTEPAYLRNITELKADTYHVLIDNIEVESVNLKVGGIYTILIAEEFPDKYRSNVVIVTEPNSVSILWLIPQYVVMTLGEVLFSVTGCEFSYAEAPVTMKSVLQACWLLTISFGDVFVIIIAELPLFDSQASEFFLFAGLMFADMIVFMFVAYCYKPNNPTQNSESEPLTPPEKSDHNGIDKVAKTIDD